MNKFLKAKIVEGFGTQADFAQAIGTQESMVSRVVQGRRSLKPVDVERWSKALRCSPEIIQRQEGEAR